MPLALETLGCLLRTKSSVSDWEGVLGSNIWDLPIENNKIMPALLLSYYHLPSNLERCFAYCALYPKDHQYDKESLIFSWMAQNFLHCSQQSKSLEEVGEQYFNDLLSRSFFQQIITDKKTYFVMHDLLNDLAKYVSGEICYNLVDREKRVSRKTRHFLIVLNHVQYDESLHYAEGLRTFISILGFRRISMQQFISNFKFLRHLTLDWCTNVEEVPDTISDLIHLRSLDLSGSFIGILPDSISSLSNLQVLKLNHCFHLTKLPSTLYELTKLRRLELMGTTLIKVPPHLGNLKNLQVWMDKFQVRKSCEFSIHQLQEVDLHGELSVRNLENMVNCCALRADFKNKSHLAGLRLEWDLERNIEDSTKEREVLENLQPSRHLEKLSINGYGGTQFPPWLSDNSLLNMVSLTLKRCKYCLWLPSLGLLTFLKHLTIGDLDWIESIDADFYGNSSCAFASLEMLSFTNMEEWKEWQCMTGAFPNLQHLSLKRCPKLKGHLPEQLSNLKHLIIVKCEQLVASIPRAVEIEDVKMEASSFDMIGPLVSHTPLECLRIDCCPGMNIPINHYYHLLLELRIIHGCDSFTIFPLDLFPKLCELELYNCHNLRTILQGHPHNHLKWLIIENCSQFESFPNEGLFALQLLRICIIGAEKLKSMPKRMCAHLPSLDLMIIDDCPRVEFSEGCLPSNLKKLHIFNCPKLVASLKEALSGNHSLLVLRISGEDIESFPDEGLLPLSLTKIEIHNCPMLKKLDYRGLCHLSSLQELIIRRCPILQSLPQEDLHESFSHLIISDNPLLQQLYKK